ncbi:hypothetical protein AB0C93_03400 [Streptomyces sp. NPDC048518]
MLSWNADGTPRALLVFTVVDGLITAVTAMTDPDRLALMDLPAPV